MGTRSTAHFVDSLDGEPEAIVYRHMDGYPAGAGADIELFLDEAQKLSDSRFGDPSYLAAKYVVWLARTFAPMPESRPLDFLSVGVITHDPGDIAYRYTIVCSGARPDVYVDALDGAGNQPLSGILQAAGLR